MRIGVLDSGIGGSFILFNLYHKYPNNQYVYLGDEMNAPYGSYENEELLNILRNNINWFKSLNIEVLIIACNTACSSGILNETFEGIKLYGIIDKTINQIDFNKYHDLLLLATPLSIKNKVYENKIKKISNINIHTKSFDRLIPMIENLESKEIINQYVKDVLKDVDADIDCVILGCTHYPIVKQQVKEIFDADIYDSNNLDFDITNNDVSSLTIYTTGNPNFVEKQIKEIFKIDVKVNKK